MYMFSFHKPNIRALECKTWQKYNIFNSSPIFLLFFLKTVLSCKFEFFILFLYEYKFNVINLFQKHCCLE